MFKTNTNCQLHLQLWTEVKRNVYKKCSYYIVITAWQCGIKVLMHDGSGSFANVNIPLKIWTNSLNTTCTSHILKYEMSEETRE